MMHHQQQSQHTKQIKIPPPGLTFSRKLMPQLGPREAFLENLDKEGIKHHKEMIDPHKLKSSQAEFDHDKIRALMTKTNTTKSAVVISNDNYVLDGHHRWLAYYNKKQKIDVIRVDLPILELIRLAKTFENTQYKDVKDVKQIAECVKRLSKAAVALREYK